MSIFKQKPKPEPVAIAAPRRGLISSVIYALVGYTSAAVGIIAIAFLALHWTMYGVNKASGFVMRNVTAEANQGIISVFAKLADIRMIDQAHAAIEPPLTQEELKERLATVVMREKEIERLNAEYDAVINIARSCRSNKDYPLKNPDACTALAEVELEKKVVRK